MYPRRRRRSACLSIAPVAQAQVELVRGGHDIPVTNENVMAYIHRVADYKLNQQIREPTAAFLRCTLLGGRLGVPPLLGSLV